MRYMFLRYPGGKPKALTFSYDDGVKQDKRLSDILTSNGLKGTFNLNSDTLRQGHGLSTQDVKDYIISRGHEVAIHGFLHRANGAVRVLDGLRDVLDCRLELEKKYDMIIRGMAYPDSGITKMSNGTSYAKVKNYLTELDVAYARALSSCDESFELPTDFHAWLPTSHHKNPELMNLADKFISIDISKVYSSGKTPKLFYVWGHSYEFDNDDNWNVIEEFCEKFSKTEDVWFATNIEIYNYVQAYNSLVFSADSGTVYNPTLIDVWLSVDNNIYCVKSAQTIKIKRRYE